MSIETEIDEMAEDGDSIFIDRDEYEQLLADSRFLAALQAAGVDNWEGYGYAQESLENDE